MRKPLKTEDISIKYGGIHVRAGEMPARCGSQGPMLCLYGSICNETLGVCTDCPVGFTNDQVLFKGNQNCGLSIAGMIVVYCITGIFALCIALVAFKSIVGKKKSRVRSVILLVMSWNLLIPCMLLAHGLEGFQYGPVAVFLSTCILMMVNTEVSAMQYTVETVMNMVLHHSTSRKIFYQNVTWYIFWMVQKIAFGLVCFISAVLNNIDLFNIVQLCLSVSIVTEVLVNLIRGYTSNRRTVAAVMGLRVKSGQRNLNPVIEEFAMRMNRTRCILPLYAIGFVFAAAAVPALFVVYDSSIPYAFIMFDILVLTWPSVGLPPIIVFHSKLGPHMDNGKGSTMLTTEEKVRSPIVANMVSPLSSDNKAVNDFL